MDGWMLESRVYSKNSRVDSQTWLQQLIISAVHYFLLLEVLSSNLGWEKMGEKGVLVSRLTRTAFWGCVPHGQP